MRIAFGIHSLAGLGGTESYVTTVADELQRTGHDVWICSPEGGASAEVAQRLGLRVAERPEQLPEGLDAALLQDAPSALEFAAVRPACPQFFVAHSDTFDLQMPPQVSGLIRAVFALYRRAYDRIVAQSVALPVERIRQPIDIERFKPMTVLSDPPRRALSFGNYLSGARLEMLREACQIAGLELEVAGALAGGAEMSPEEVLSGADIVFGKARVIHEAMACGRAAYVLDHNGAEGWVTAANYDELVDDNFGGRSRPRPLTGQALAADLALYNTEMGVVNRDLMVANHSVVTHVSELVGFIRKYLDEPAPHAPDPGNLEELARLTRVNWRHESDAFRLRKLLEIRSAELNEMARRATIAEQEREWLAERLEYAQATLDEIVGSRRHRVTGALARPFDKLRGRG
ncbi:MAG: hypothetical protein HZB14_03645 [Actinobacteria bacterium]|nr:hypothetical protein [Actinomycetota bacterium]